MDEETQPTAAVAAPPRNLVHATIAHGLVADEAIAKLRGLADMFKVEGEHHTVSLARAGVAVGIESPVNVMGNDKAITAQDLAALEVREWITGQKAADWLKHFNS